MDPGKAVMKPGKSGREIQGARQTLKIPRGGRDKTGLAAITAKRLFIQFIPALVT